MFYTNEEVALHCIPEDCWVSIFDHVLDVTSLIQSGKDTKTILKYAGKSVSHWFDNNKETGEISIKTFVDPLRNVSLPYLPEGRILHVPPPDPLSGPEVNIDVFSTPWWKQSILFIGKVRLNMSSLYFFNIYQSIYLSIYPYMSICLSRLHPKVASSRLSIH